MIGKLDRIRTLGDLARRRQWTPHQTREFLRGLIETGHRISLRERREAGDDVELPVDGGSANFTQVSGPQGRTQTLNAGAAPVTFIWNPQSLKGQLAGGDFIYASRAKFRTILTLTNGGESSLITPNWQQLAQALGNFRVFSPFLGEMAPKSLNSVALLSNHDQYFVNGFRPITRKRGGESVGSGGVVHLEFIFEYALERDYLVRSSDSMPWLPFLEGGIIECDLAPSTSLANYGWTVNAATQTCTIDWYTDKQALIHAPAQSRLYRVTTGGPEYVLKSVGSPNGLDGVISGSRLAVLSWLATGIAVNGTGDAVGDNGFYGAFGGAGGPAFGTNGLNRLDVPWRDQTSIDDVSAWLESFLADCNPVRMFENLNVTGNNTFWTDINQWPFVMAGSSATIGAVAQSLIADFLDFWPLVWVPPGAKIADMQKVNGDLSFTASWTSAPDVALNLFRSDEICGFTPDKVMDLMDRMGLTHQQRGGAYIYVPKYAGAKKADPTTTWGFPLKIIKAK